MKKAKKFLGALVVFMAIAFVITGCNVPSANASPSDKVYTLKVAHQAAVDHPWQLAALDFKKAVEEKTQGKVLIETYFGGTLGYDRDLFEGLQFGTVDLAFISTAPMSAFLPEIGVLDLPYVFRNWDHLEAFLDSQPAKDLSDKLKGIGIVNISFFPGGFRQLTNNVRPITKLEDLKNLKIRVMQSDVYIDTFTALGAAPVPMAWGEVQTSLQQGTIAGQENPNIVNETNNIWEMQKYMSMTGHCAYMTAFTGSERLLSQLPKEYYDMIMEIGKEVCLANIKKVRVEEDRILENIKGKGMEVNELDTAPLAAATVSVRDAFAAKNGGDIMNAIMNLAK